MYDLAVATTTYFGSYGYVSDSSHRMKYWDWFCESIERTNLDGKKIILIVSDDGSPIVPEKRKFPFDSEWHVHIEHGGIPFSSPWTVQHASQYAPWVINADSDAYFHPEWANWLFSVMQRYPEETAFNLFNSPRQTEILGMLEGGKILIKGSSQEHGRVISSMDLNTRSNWKPEDWDIRHIPTSRKILVPRVSMIQHTGCYGLNNVPGGSEDYDPDFPFNHLCGLPDRLALDTTLV